MSALTDYIHFYYIHYIKYGITRKNEAGKGTPNYSIKAIDKRIKNNVKPINPKTILELEKRLKANSYRGYQQSINKIQQKRQKIIDLIYQQLAKKSEQIEGIQRLYTVASGGIVQYTNSKMLSGKESVLLQNQAWASSLSYQQLLKVREKAAKMYQNINQLIDEINKEGTQNEQKFFKLVNLVNQYSNLTLDPTKHTLGEIQTALHQYNYKGTIENISGQFGEMMVATCDDVCYNLAENATDKEIERAFEQVIDQNIVGKQQTRAVMNKKLVGAGYGITRRSAKDRNEYYLGTTSNKVDVEIKIQEEPVIATVKTSENLHSSRPSLQTVDLYPTLTFLNSQVAGLENFGTHWLNMHCIRAVPQSVLGVPKDRDKLDNILKKEVAYEALSSGNPFKKGVKSANIFVYINRSTGKVYVKSVQELLDNVNSMDNRIGGLARISTLRYKQQWQPEIWQRLNDILRQVHATKLSIALNIKY